MSNAVPLGAFAHFEQDDRAPRHHPPGAVPGGHGVVQPRAGRVARGAIAAIDEVKRDLHMPPRACSASFQGTAAAFTQLADQRAAADPGRARHRLHRARRPLRELHPPGHDPVDAAVGRRRRAPRAPPLPPGSQRRRDHRHRPADRHREEERHHDGRLRARGGAQARQDRAATRSTRRACCASARS